MNEVENIEVTVATPDVDSGQPNHQVTITDRKAQRAWSGEGSTSSEAATEATRKFIGDRRAPEYLKK